MYNGHNRKGKIATISIDDFGSGYRSLIYLCKLSVDEVKVDHTVVLEAHQTDDAEIIIIRTIMSYEFGFEAVLSPLCMAR